MNQCSACFAELTNIFYSKIELQSDPSKKADLLHGLEDAFQKTANALLKAADASQDLTQKKDLFNQGSAYFAKEASTLNSIVELELELESDPSNKIKLLEKASTALYNAVLSAQDPAQKKDLYDNQYHPCCIKLIELLESMIISNPERKTDLLKKINDSLSLLTICVT